MKLFSTGLTATLLAQVVLGDGEVTSECNGDSTRGRLVMTIPYDISGSELISMRAGDCDETSTDSYTTTQTATHFIVDVDIDDCNLDVAVSENPTIPASMRNLAAGYYQTTATVELGRRDDTMVYSYYEATINTECGTETNYVATYEYGTIDHQSHSDELLPGTYNEHQFKITGYTDSTYETEAETSPSRAGDRVYLAVSPAGDDFVSDRFTFAVKSCTFTNNEQSVDAALFDHESEDCGNAFVDLTHGWANGQWRMSHRVFVFGDGSTSTYKLTCQIKLCEEAEHNNPCDDVKTNCGVDDGTNSEEGDGDDH